MENYVIKCVESSADVKDFHRVARSIYRDDPNWVCPTVKDVEHIFSPQYNSLFTVDGGGQAVRWLLMDSEGLLVGRIAAFYNRQKAANERQMTGGCGFFECIDSVQAATLLFDTARDWLKEQGMEAMDGSINFGDRMQWWGVLVEGFTAPLYAMNYNRPYYAALFEAYGFEIFFNQITYARSLVDGVRPPEALYQKAQRLFDNDQYSFVTFDKRRVGKMAEDFCQIYNQAWAKFDGVSPLTASQARKMIDSMLPIIDSEVLFMAYHNDQPIGFFVMLPDINQLLIRFNGRMGMVEKLRLLWGIRRKRITGLAGLIFGVVPQYQGHGVEAALIRKFEMQIGDKRQKNSEQYTTLEMGWIGDFNPVMMRMCESYVRAVRHKRHVTYRYLFDRSAPFERAARMK